MATDTVPAAVPGPPDPPSNADTTTLGARGLLASMVAPVEPARPTFTISPTLGDTQPTPDGDGILDRSTPGQSSASFRDTTDQAAKSNDPAGSRHKRSIWKEMWLAAATRWAKGGGTANKRLDLQKAKAQANAYQVKETRTTTHMKSPGLPVRNTGGSGAGTKGDTGKSGGNFSGKGPANSNGNRSGGAGSGGSGGRGPGGGAGSNGSGGSGRGGRQQHTAGDRKNAGPSGAGGRGHHAAGGSGGAGKTPAADKKHTGASGKDTGKGPGKTPGAAGGSSGAGGAGKQGASGSSGKAGKDGSPGKSGTPGKTDLTKAPKGKQDQAHGKSTGQQQATEKTPLQKSRETGHGDGSKVRRVVDHMKAYKDGAVDGYHDEKDKNAKEHDRLDKARADRKTGKDQPADGKPAQDPNGQATKDPNGQPAKDDGKPQPVTATTQGHTVLIEDDNAPMEDPFMGKATPIQAKGIDTDKITLGGGFRKSSVKRSELRRFKDYEGRLEARIGGFAKVVDATKALTAQAREQAEECQTLLEDAKGVKGGEKLVGELQKLTEQAKAQADEADEVHTAALKAHDFGKAVLANVQTRYQPLYQAVVDSDEVKPAELKFYKDRGITPSHTTLAA